MMFSCCKLKEHSTREKILLMKTINAHSATAMGWFRQLSGIQLCANAFPKALQLQRTPIHIKHYFLMISSMIRYSIMYQCFSIGPTTTIHINSHKTLFTLALNEKDNTSRSK